MLSMPRIVRPDPHRFRRRNLVPPLDRPLADPLSETKNWRNLLTGKCDSQVSHSLPAHLERFIGDEAIPDSRLGLNETWICRIAFNLLSKVGDINAEILAVLFRFRAPDFAKDVAMCEDATRMPDEQSKQRILGRRELDFTALLNSYFRFPSSLRRRSEKSAKAVSHRKKSRLNRSRASAVGIIAATPKHRTRAGAASRHSLHISALQTGQCGTAADSLAFAVDFP